MAILADVRIAVLLLQVAKPDFFLKMTPMFDAGDNVGMVRKPRRTHMLFITLNKSSLTCSGQCDRLPVLPCASIAALSVSIRF